MIVRRLFLLVLAFAQAGAALAPVGQDPKFKYILPAGFRGWVCVDFGVAGAPPLSQDAHGLYVIEAADLILKTSSLPNLKTGSFPSEIVEIVDGQPRPIRLRFSQERSEYNSSSPISRVCRLFGTRDPHSVQRPPTLRESEIGTSPILNEFEFIKGSLCDFTQVTSVCIDAKDVRQRNIGRAIASAIGIPATVKNDCDKHDGVAVEYRAEWGAATHSTERVTPKPFAEIRRVHPTKGTMALAIWSGLDEESAEAGASRIGRDLIEMFRKATTSCAK